MPPTNDDTGSNNNTAASFYGAHSGRSVTKSATPSHASTVFEGPTPTLQDPLEGTSVRTPKRPGQFTHKDELLKASDIQGKTFGTDYIVLSYNTYDDTIDSRIHAKGLKSLEQRVIAGEANEEETETYTSAVSRKWFGENPSLVYTGPVYPGSAEKATSTSILLAAHPDSVRIYNQRWQGSSSGTQPLYTGTSLAPRDYATRASSLPQGHYLNMYGRSQRREQPTFGWGEYRPHCPIEGGVIPPELFIPHDLIPDSAKA